MRRGTKFFTITRTATFFELKTGRDNKLAWSYQLSDLAEASTWSSLFDEYKLCAIKVRMMPRSNVHNLDNKSVYSGCLFTVVDYDDAVLLGSKDEAVQYASCKSNPLTRQVGTYFKPKYAGAAFVGATSTGYVPKRGWLDLAYPGIPHYGLKLFCQIGGLPDDATYVWDVVTTYYVGFRNRR